MASMEQKKADENVLRLVEEQQVCTTSNKLLNNNGFVVYLSLYFYINTSCLISVVIVDLVSKFAEGEGGGPKRHTEARAGAG